MRNAPILGPYGDKTDKNKSVRHSINARDVISEQLKRDYADMEAIRLSMEITRSPKNAPKQKK